MLKTGIKETDLEKAMELVAKRNRLITAIRNLEPAIKSGHYFSVMYQTTMEYEVSFFTGNAREFAKCFVELIDKNRREVEFELNELGVAFSPFVTLLEKEASSETAEASSVLENKNSEQSGEKND